MNGNEEQRCVLLVADDDDDDQLLITDAFRECQFDGQMLFADNGEKVLQMLEQMSDDELPAMILLDLNMPRMSGYEVLEKLKNHPRHRRIPVVVLTTSNDAEDISRAYDLGSNCFITKPNRYDDLVKSVRSLIHYWCEVASLPATQ